MSSLPHFGAVVANYAQLLPDKIGTRDLDRAMTFAQWNARSCRLANALLGLGLAKGDRVALLAYNCLEWMEIYAATAKAGLIAVPINFRLMGPEIRYIAQDCDARAFIVQDELIERIADIRRELPIPQANYICIGQSAGRLSRLRRFSRCRAGQRAGC